MHNYDVLIIGAGIAGASAGYELAGQRRVAVLEAEDSAGYHSTGRSAAQFLETYGNATIQRLTRASRAFYDAPPAGFAEHPLLSPRPAIYVARADQLEELARLEDEVRQMTPDVARLDRGEILKMVPVLRPEFAAGGLVERLAMDIDVHALHQGYLKGLRQRGGALAFKAQVTAIRRAGDVWQVETRAGTFSAPIVVNAAGAWADEIGKLAGVRPIGLIPKRRTAIVIDPPDGLDPRPWPLVALADESFYFKPDAGRIFASPADQTPSPPCDVQPDEMDVAITAERIETVTTLPVRSIAHKWAGLRSFVADKSLVIGMDPDLTGFFWLAGQGGYGIQTAPAAARTTAALATGAGLPEDVAAQGLSAQDLAPERLRR